MSFEKKDKTKSNEKICTDKFHTLMGAVVELVPNGPGRDRVLDLILAAKDLTEEIFHVGQRAKDGETRPRGGVLGACARSIHTDQDNAELEVFSTYGLSQENAALLKSDFFAAGGDIALLERMFRCRLFLDTGNPNNVRAAPTCPGDAT